MDNPFIIIGSRATYAVRDELGRLGCKWDKSSRQWFCPSSVAEEAQRTVELQGNELEDMSSRYQAELRQRWADRAAGGAHV